jgi:hypothetical protein
VQLVLVAVWIAGRRLALHCCQDPSVCWSCAKSFPAHAVAIRHKVSLSYVPALHPAEGLYIPTSQGLRGISTGSRLASTWRSPVSTSS